MADAYGQQQRGIDPDVREWSPETRRRASIGIFAVTAILAIVGAIFYFAAPGVAGWVLIAAIIVLVLLLLAEVAIVATGIATEDDAGPDWLRGSAAQTATAGTAPPAREEPAGAGPEIDLRCPQCQELFTVQDTGQRPLAIDCPHCGAHGQVDLPESHEHSHEHDHAHAEAPAHEDPGAQTQAGSSLADEPLPGLEEEEAAAEDLPAISLKCPACGTQFDVEDDGQRPLKTTCPGCGKSGKLK